MEDFALGTWIKCTQSRYSALKIDLNTTLVFIMRNW